MLQESGGYDRITNEVVESAELRAVALENARALFSPIFEEKPSLSKR
jgi:hypothetical protein